MVRPEMTVYGTISLVITSPEDVWIQTVHILLQVAYLEQNRRIATPDLDNDTNAIGQ